MEKPNVINWGPILFLVIYQVVLLAGLPFYFYYNVPSTAMIVATFILLYLTGLSITAGYHRYFAHRTYRTGSIMETILLFFGTMAVQSSALRWSFDHRVHHAHVDTDKDPHSIHKGFWYAHFLWLFEKPKEIEPKIVSDLLKNKLVMFQHRYYKILMIVSNAIPTLLLGWFFNDYLGAVVLALGLRMFLLHHFTWFINSLAHTFGDKPFSQEQTAVDNYLLSLATFGEGYHNYHHTYANDYRNGIRWYHFDPTKWLIWSLNKIGVTYNLKRMDTATIQKRIVIEHKNLLLERIKALCYVRKEELENVIQEISERMVTKIAQFNKLKEEYSQTKREKPSRDIVYDMQQELKQLKKSLREDCRLWLQLSKRIMSLKPLPAQ